MTRKFLVAASVPVLAYMSYEKNSMNDFFNANVEALTSGEGGDIIVGPLCMKMDNAACTSLGEVFLEHYPV